jgi:hypothetical protein
MNNTIRYLDCYAKNAERQDWFAEQREKENQANYERAMQKEKELRMRNINKFYARYKTFK